MKVIAMSHEQLNVLLLEHLSNVPTRPDRSGIVWMDDPARGKGGVPRWEVSIGYSNPKARSLAYGQEIQGDLRVIIVSQAGEYEASAKHYAGAIAEQFRPGTRLGPIRISAEPHRPGGYKDGAEYRYPVLIRFRALI